MQVIHPSVFQTQYEASEAELVCTCLDVIGKFISWIDINLIANDKFVPVIIRFMSAPLLRESACDCIHEIISKGMDPVAKTKLIESFAEVLENVGVLNVAEVRFTSILTVDIFDILITRAQSFTTNNAIS